MRSSLIQVNNDLEQLNIKLNHLLKISALDQSKRGELMKLNDQFNQIQIKLQGQQALSKYEFATPNAINSSFWGVYYEMLGSLTKPTLTHINTIQSIEEQLPRIEKQMEEIKTSLQNFN